MRLFATLINLDSITVFFLSDFLEISENPWTAISQRYRKAWNTVWNSAKIHDLKKAPQESSWSCIKTIAKLHYAERGHFSKRMSFWSFLICFDSSLNAIQEKICWNCCLQLRYSPFTYSRFKTFSTKPHHHVRLVFIDGVVIVDQNRLYY